MKTVSRRKLLSQAAAIGAASFATIEKGYGTVTSRNPVEQALAAIAAPAGEGARTFIQVHREAALAAGARSGPLAGLPISIKDNFDEAGVVTLAGSKVLVGSPAAARDATVVARLRAAGAVIIGRTNMTEFAYSGLGLNPHYGTPRNVFDRASGRIPGGSSSGAAISVADSMAWAAIGTDTGGSVRIPAALNGLVGFKPTARRVPLDGVLPLSISADSVGPIARSVADCVRVDRVLSASTAKLPTLGLKGLRLGVAQTAVLADLSPAVAAAFTRTLARLSAAGAGVSDVAMTDFGRVQEVNPRGGISSAEAWWWHREWIKRAEEYDPRVLARIKPGEAISAASYIEMLQQRKRFIRDVEAAANGFDALLMPTVIDTAPTIAEVSVDDESYFRINSRMLRNPSLVNLFDGCALTLPCHAAGEAPVGLSIVGTGGQDDRVLAIGLAVEALFSGAR